jgi:hypothetical protein
VQVLPRRDACECDGQGIRPRARHKAVHAIAASGAISISPLFQNLRQGAFITTHNIRMAVIAKSLCHLLIEIAELEAIVSNANRLTRNGLCTLAHGAYLEPDLLNPQEPMPTAILCQLKRQRYLQ